VKLDSLASEACLPDGFRGTIRPASLTTDLPREIAGRSAIRSWVMKELICASVTLQVRRVREHYGQFIVDAVYDGTFDETILSSEVVLTNYFRVVNDQIVHLTIIFNQSSPY
jgi:hypothetical protein